MWEKIDSGSAPQWVRTKKMDRAAQMDEWIEDGLKELRNCENVPDWCQETNKEEERERVARRINLLCLQSSKRG